MPCSTSQTRFLCAAAVCALAFAVAVPAHAAPKAKYVFQLATVDLAKGLPAHVADRVREALNKEFADNPTILTELPEGAPDPKAEPKKFKRYLDKRKLRAFHIRVDVTGYERVLEPMPEGRSGQRLKVSVQLRMFGETIPDRSMAFAGAGSATIKLDIGKKVRERDDKEAHAEAFGIACSDAVAESLAKLALPPAKTQTKKKRRKKKK